jgi:AraC-like DNA-binding protein
MDISTHDMSYLLNDGFGQSFFQFINTYRIEEAKRLLMSEKHSHFNMLGIAYASGFSSKTTFNTTFKKLTQQSPSEFQNEQKKNGSVSLPLLFSSEKS